MMMMNPKADHHRLIMCLEIRKHSRLKRQHVAKVMIVNQILPINQPKARAVKKGINQNPQGKKLSVLYKRDYLSGGLLWFAMCLFSNN